VLLRRPDPLVAVAAIVAGCFHPSPSVAGGGSAIKAGAERQGEDKAMPDDLIALARKLEEMDFSTPEFLANLTDDVTFEAAGSRELLPWAGRWKGPEGLKSFRTLLGTRVKYNSWKPLAWFRDGDTVIEHAHATGTARESGLPFETDLLRLWVFRERKVSRMVTMYDTLSYALAVGAVAVPGKSTPPKSQDPN
jgi:ketosteroid isomerase-like protein